MRTFIYKLALVNSLLSIYINFWLLIFLVVDN